MRTCPALLTAIAFVSSLVVSVSPADAQLFDHLKCYKVKDPAKFKADATLAALDAQFGDETCKVIGKAMLACTPVDKTSVSSFVDKSKEQFGQLEVDGADLAFDRLCYKIKCKTQAPEGVQMSDQFGTRDLSKLKAQLLCTPAIQGDPAATTTTLVTTTTVTTTTLGQVPDATILGPPDGGTHSAGVAISFSGEADDPQDGPLTGSALVWTSDQQGLIGLGEAFNAALSVVGVHEITLTATDSDLNTAISSITLTVDP